jgi:N-acetylglucosaminyl-diphospho-decaprenol L-rhamnosyltransferase
MGHLEESQPDRPHVDVVIVAHDGEETIGRLISTLKASIGVSCRLIVVDNASSDRTVELARGLGAIVVAGSENVGYGAAFNQGLAIATAEWVVCANQDVIVDPVAVRILVDAATAQEAYGARPGLVGPALRDDDGELIETFNELPTLWRQVAELVGGESLAGQRGVVPSGPGPQPCGWMSAAFVLGRRSIFEAVGGFDPAYFMYVEDVDLFTRLAGSGRVSLWVPDAVVTHLGGVRAAMSPVMVAHALWGWGRYFGLRHGRITAVAVRVAGLVGVSARAAVWGMRSRRGIPQSEVMRRAYAETTRRFVRSALTGRRPARPV